MFYTNDQPDFTGAASIFPYSPWLEQKYIFTNNFGDEVRMALHRGNTLHVPRETAPIGRQDYRVHYPLAPAIDCAFVPRNDEQRDLVTQSIALLKSGVNHVFDAPTGWGKSVAGAAIAAGMGQPTMIVVQKQDLLDSWHDALVNKLGIPADKVGKVQQDVCSWKGKQFVIGMAQSLIIPDRYDPDMYRHFGLLVLDEVHSMAADCFINVCWKFPAKYRLGFSATPTRSDGKWKVIEAHIGTVRCKGTMIPMQAKILVKKTGWRIPTTRKFNAEAGVFEDVKISHAPGRMMLVNKAMASHNGRNKIIVEFIQSAHSAGRHVLAMGDLKDGLDQLFTLITRTGISGENIGYYVGGMSKVELEHTKKKPIVLATYQMCSTGTNVPVWDSLVMLSPRANVKQAVGRVLRFVEGKKQPVILDLVDYDKLFNNFYLSRLRQYYEIGATIVPL